MSMRIALAALIVAGAGASAHAGELAPFGGESIELGSIRGVTYYAESPGGYRVVTTLADGETGLPVRFEATLADTQRLTISVPGKPGEKSATLEIARTGSKLVLTRQRAIEESVVVARPQVPAH